MTVTVEVNVRQVLAYLYVFIFTVNNIRDAMILSFGDLNARARDPTATSGVINLLMRPMVGVSPKTILWVAVEGSILYSAKATNANRLWVTLSLRVIPSWSHVQYQGCHGNCNILTIAVPIRLMYVIILTFRSTWEFNGECIVGFSRHSNLISPYDLRREFIRIFLMAELSFILGEIICRSICVKGRKNSE